MYNLFNRLTITTFLFLALITNTGLSFADQKLEIESKQVASEVSVPTLAMHDADAMAAKKNEKSVAKSGPVLLVPMVLAVLALVAVSRRKEG